jgi:hypothetical protein
MRKTLLQGQCHQKLVLNRHTRTKIKTKLEVGKGYHIFPVLLFIGTRIYNHTFKTNTKKIAHWRKILRKYERTAGAEKHAPGGPYGSTSGAPHMYVFEALLA